jgi:hypothetical protein
MQGGSDNGLNVAYEKKLHLSALSMQELFLACAWNYGRGLFSMDNYFDCIFVTILKANG